MAYRLTAARRRALRKAQLASARKRRGSSRRRRVVAAVAVGAVLAPIVGRKTKNHVNLFKEAREFQSSGFDPESGYGPGRAKYTYRKHLRYRRSAYKTQRRFYRNKMKNILLGRQSKHPLANGLLAMQVRSGQYKYQSKTQKLIKTTIRYRQGMKRIKADPTL